MTISVDNGTRDEVRAFIRSSFLFLRPDAELGDDDDLLDLGVIDSLGFVELVEHVSSTYGVQVRDEDLVTANFGSVAAVCAFVAARRAR